MFGLPSAKQEAQGVFLTAAPNASRKGGDAAERARALSAESLTVVHLIASSLRVDRSLATAIRFAASHAGGVAAEELERLEWAVRIRHFASVDEGFLAFASAVGASDPEFKRALVTLHGAEAEGSREALERRLDRAYDIVVRAEERRRERLVATLERPSQALFGLGVVLPLVLAALLPMAQLAGGALGVLPSVLLLVVAVPALTFAGSARILDKNFLGRGVESGRAREAAIAGLVGAVAAGAVVLAAPWLSLPFDSPAVWAALAGAIASPAAGLNLARMAGSQETERAAIEGGLADLLHSVGTKMVAGRSAEHALMDTVEASKESALGKRLRGVLFDVVVGRRSLGDAIERDAEVREAPRVFPALRLLASTADRDTQSAGRVLLHLSEFERLRGDAAQSLRARLGSVVETTHTTVTLFAPLILGITAGMYGLLSRIGASFVAGANSAPPLDAAAFAGVVVVYLCLEIAIADWFAARLLDDAPVAGFARRIARDVPVAMGLFAAALLGSSALF
jgi:hypothetical protein